MILERVQDNNYPTQCFARGITISLQKNGLLVSNMISGESTFDNGEQMDTATQMNWTYDVNGVNTIMEVKINYDTIKRGALSAKSLDNYRMLSGNLSTRTFMRSELDLAWCNETKQPLGSQNSSEKKGYCVLSGEYGFQKMKPMPNPNDSQGSYIWPDKDVTLTVDYARDLAKDPQNVAEVLGKFLMNQQTAFDMYSAHSKNNYRKN